ncbi:hypothetical protein GsuE55_23630 [Geobacillus subterraneus]|uniref:Uncharacterized protein n=1 Tax=Geobacillus subterraneus TaxID=129338 RepID=A0A679FNI0_9BACL|nr:hypothetical protein B4113_0046 [Geobacillus sp. B4113_201601]BBW97530.1 hypothetical protein GsuE55_23630 [Geobacillus subterraneus]
MSSIVDSIEKEMKRRAYEAAMAILRSYQGQVHEAMEEFQGAFAAFIAPTMNLFRTGKGRRGKRMSGSMPI